MSNVLRRYFPYLAIFFVWVASAGVLIGRAIAPAPAITVYKTVGTTTDPAKDDGPIHGYNPLFTAVPMEICPGRGGSFCPYEICSNSVPQTPNPGKLWNATVVGGKDGPVLICEWRH